MHYTIYMRPTDYPDVVFLVREWAVTAGGAIAGGVIGTSETIDGARALVPAQADFCLPRRDSDDPIIVETWM
jgi:hypothetical protein